MLKLVVHWLDIAGTVADVALLFRILGLRLNRVYTFIALDAVLSVIFDAAYYWRGPESAESFQIFLLSRYLYAVVLPAVAWDIFEEMKPDVEPARRLAGMRLISSILSVAVFTLLYTMFMSDTAEDGRALTGLIGLVLWCGACFASIFFLITVTRAMKLQGKRQPQNTETWRLYYLITLSGSLVDTILFVLIQKASDTQRSAVQILFAILGLACTIWCLLRLRSRPLDPQTAMINPSA